VTSPDPSNPALDPNATVKVDDVSKWFGQKVAVSGVTCSFGPGLTGLLGPNGAGKTTLLRMLVGLIRPSQGRVTVLGVELRDAVDRYADVGFVPEESAVYGRLTAFELVTYGARLSGIAEPEKAARASLDEVGLRGDADRSISGFSKGMRQRAKVAAALVHRPQILVLDEPLNGTDPVQRAHLIDILGHLAAGGATVIVSSHVLQEVERMTERVIAIVDGKLAAAGDIGAIRQAMSDIPYRVLIETDRPRRLAAALLTEAPVDGVAVEGRTLHVETSDLAGLGVVIAPLALRLDARLARFAPEDESLESVFRYLVNRR